MSRGPKMILVSGGYDHTIRFWDVSNGSMTKQLQACTPTCSPHFFWHGRGTVPAVLRACCSTLHRPAHAAATLGQGPLRACALTSTGGLAVPRLADQRAADFARCAPGHRISGVFAHPAWPLAPQNQAEKEQARPDARTRALLGALVGLVTHRRQDEAVGEAVR
jgi:hypothetical protein